MRRKQGGRLNRTHIESDIVRAGGMPPNQGRRPGRTIPSHADPLPNAQHSLIYIRHFSADPTHVPSFFEELNLLGRVVSTMGVVQDGANKLVGLAKTWGYYGWIPVTIYLGQSSTVACSWERQANSTQNPHVPGRKSAVLCVCVCVCVCVPLSPVGDVCPCVFQRTCADGMQRTSSSSGTMCL